MGTVGCWLNLLKTNSRVTFRIRNGVIRDDGRLFPDRCGESWCKGGSRRWITRNQSTRVQAAGARSRPRASTSKNSAQVSEEITCASKQLHSFSLSEQQLATAAATASTHKVPPPLEMPSESAVESSCDIMRESDRDFVKSLFQDRVTFYPNISDEIRWNQGPLHTYDSSFMLPDTVSETLRINEGNLKVIMDSELNHPHGSLLPVENLSNEIKSLIGNKKNILHKTKDGNTKTLKSGKESAVTTKKRKKGIVKKVSTAVNKEKLSPDTTQKTVPPLSRKKVLKSKSKHKLHGPEVLHILEENVEAQEPSQTPAPKVEPTPKAKKGVKKHKKNKKDEEKYFKEVRRRGRETSFNQSLAAYISVCINLGMLNRATHTLLYYRQCAHHSNRKDECQKVNSVQVYNLIFQGYANKKNFKKMKELFRCLKEDGIDPDVTTYALLLSCLGQQEMSENNTQNIRLYLEDMNNEGFTLEDVFSQAEILENDLKCALKAVTQVDPNFEIKQVKTETEYSCNLVNNLNTTMYSTKVPSPAHGIVTQEMLNKWMKEQFALEASSQLVINSIEKKEESKNTHHYRKILEDWEEKWRSVLRQTFITQLGVMKKSFYGSGLDKRMSIYPYLVSLPPEEFISIMMQEIQRLARGSESFSFTKYMMFRRLGELVYMRYVVKYKKEVGVLDRLKDVYKDYTTWYLDNEKENVTYIPRVRWQELADSHCSGPALEHSPVEWPSTVMTSIGKFMYSVILLKVMLWNPLHAEKHVYPAIYEVERTKGYRTVDEIKPSPSLVELYQKAAKPTLTFESIVSPMVCPPLPWVSTNLGGYLLNNAKIVRLPYNAYQQKQRMEECGNQQLYPIMDSLNQLSSIPWRVNKPMLDIITELFNSNGCEELDIPQPPSQCPQPQKIQPGMSSVEVHKIRNQRVDFEQRKNEMHSLWCDALYKLSLAHHFQDRIFWFPHNMDFRGRVYPCPPHLNHLSSDVFRSILKFAKGEKLGSNGLQWLKLHLINLTGFVKREPVEDRIKYCESIMEDILDSADHPLTGRRWWTKSDEPWQTLAACKELAAALRSGNPEEYVSQLPVHQDGSCNGLQHYAALGRDKIGAMSVNLAPSKAPQDVYSDVAALVEAERQKDAASGTPVAKVLEGHVKRKVIKQTVMTTVYGVTRYGARLQIEKQLKALDGFPASQRWAASHYLVHKTFLCLEKMFTSTKEIQNWFTDCAKIVSETRGENLEYITPLGLPVVQPYSKFVGDQISIGKLPSTFYTDSFMKPNVMKQKNAFPPNFIHSLDSSHMMLTSLHCQQAGITFVSVHDCFWTHACSVNIMNKICRDQFVALHKEPILEDLSRFLQKKFGLSKG
ncbi:hypothetical protein O3P69_000847 [Scylla paramamosain]